MAPKNSDKYDPLEDKELLFELLQAMTANPEDIKIEEKTNGPNITILTVQVHEEDRGKIIGRQGKMIQAIQHVFQGIGAADKRRIEIKFGHQGPHKAKKYVMRRENDIRESL